MSTTLLITVKGPQCRVDLEVPGERPVWDLLPELLKICSTTATSTANMSPALWGLGQSDAKRCFDVRQSLQASGVVDGDVLHLQSIEAWARRSQMSDVDPALRGVVRRWDKEGLMH
jgi:hypothetical protein